MKIRIPKRDEKGNGLLITMILVLVMMVIVVGSLSIAGLQSDINFIDKETSNASTLAESAVQKTVDNINKEIELATYDIMEEVRKETLTKVKNDVGQLRTKQKYDDLVSKLKYVDHTEGQATLPTERDGTFGTSKNKIIFHDSNAIKDIILQEIRKKILIDNGASYDPKQITYDVNSDYAFDVKNKGNEGTVTRVTVTISDGGSLDKYMVSAVTQILNSSGSVIESQQSNQAIIEIDMPDRIDAYINERYEWFDEDNPAEVLSGAIMSYSPLILKSGTLNVTAGDVKVTGVKTQKSTLNGANSDVPLTKNFKGVSVEGSAKLNITAGNLYCGSNVAVTSKVTETSPAEINVSGDVIGDTLAIFDGFGLLDDATTEPWKYENKRTGKITIGGSAFLENDVLIEKYVDGGNITVGKSIYGIMNGDRERADDFPTDSGGTVKVVDPNMSSGIFNRGTNSLIKAHNAFVHGQPYINFGDGNGYHELYESIGEPYEDVYSLEEYRKELDSTPDYLTEDPYKGLIKKDLIQIDGQIYAPQWVSANGTTLNNKKDVLSDGSNALRFFYVHQLYGLPAQVANDFTGYDYVYDGFAKYYAGDPSLVGEKDFYAKKLTNPISGASSPTEVEGVEFFGGVRAVMIARRSPLYKEYDDGRYVFDLLSFNEATNLNYLDGTMDWSIANPVLVTAGGTVDISQFYVDGNPYPTVLINKGSGTLTLKASGGKNFTGIIVSEGPVDLESGAQGNNITITGTLVLGKSLDLNNNTLNVAYDKNVIFGANYADKEVFRYILDALNITKFCEPDSSDPSNIANALNAFEPVGLGYKYTLPRVKLTEDLHLTVETQNIVAKIEELKKIKN